MPYASWRMHYREEKSEGVTDRRFSLGVNTDLPEEYAAPLFDRLSAIGDNVLKTAIQADALKSIARNGMLKAARNPFLLEE